MKNLLLIMALSSIFFWSCKGRQYTPETFTKRQIVFGSGGGVTGKYEVYTLLENGQFFYKNSITEETKELSRVPKKEIKGMLKTMKEMDFKNQATNDPGNYNHFITIKEGEETYKCAWAEGQKPPISGISTLYRNLMGMTKPDM